jgi:hypothetical protein
MAAGDSALEIDDLITLIFVRRDLEGGYAACVG